MTEAVLLDIAAEVSRCRGALREIFEEIHLALQALDVLETRLGRLADHPGAPRYAHDPNGTSLGNIHPVPPVILSREHRQREQTG